MAQLPRDGNHPIDNTAKFGELSYLGKIQLLGAGSSIGDWAVIEDDVSIGASVSVGESTVIKKSVKLTDSLTIYTRCFFFEVSGVCSASRKVTHDYARKVYTGTIVGPRVILPSEVQVGPYAIIPTQDCIDQIGPFGESSRMVTVHGSRLGASYNVGCQEGIDEDTLRERIINGSQTTRFSAADYLKNLGSIIRLAEKTQKAFEKAAGFTGELEEMVSEHNRLIAII